MELTYKSDPKLKTMFVKEMELHRKADDFLKGTYGTMRGKKWKGCAVGCGVKSLNQKLGKKYSTSNHKAYETELGIPEWLARLEDTIFEGLPLEDSKKWPVQFSKAIPVGKDVTKVKWQFCVYLLKENIERVLELDISDELKEQVIKSIQGSLKVNEDALNTGEWDESARSAAESAAESAARSAKEKTYIKHSKELLKLLKEI